MRSFFGDDLPVGPSMGSGTVFTDKATIRAVQQALKDRGFSPGKIDGIYGPQTEAALFKFSGHHGPPDETTLYALRVTPGSSGVSGDKAVVEVAKAKVEAAEAKVSEAATPVQKEEAKKQVEVAKKELAAVKSSGFNTLVPLLNLPLWQVALGALAIGGGAWYWLSKRNTQGVRAPRNVMQLRPGRRR